MFCFQYCTYNCNVVYDPSWFQKSSYTVVVTRPLFLTYTGDFWQMIFIERFNNCILFKILKEFWALGLLN